MELACPSCKSGDVRRLSLVHREGTSHIQTKTKGLGIGFGGGGIGIGGASGKTTGTSQTTLSLEAAPPVRRKIVLAALGVLLGLALLPTGFAVLDGSGGMGTMGVILMAWGGYTVYKGVTFNKHVYPDLLSRWEKSFLCNRCGDVFIPSN